MKMMQAVACGLAMALAASFAPAAEFPLRVALLSEAKVSSLPGVSGLFIQLLKDKPSAIAGAPQAKSDKPLYGFIPGEAKELRWALMLDETGGTGKGYDTLILDLNHNGDLTDDAPIAARPLPSPAASQPAGSFSQRTFGPIEAPVGPEGKGKTAPVFVLSMAPSGGSSEGYYGYARILPGARLEADIALGGAKEKIALVDANGNLRYGDAPKRQEYNAPTAADSYRYYSSGDIVLRDRDGSGDFESDMCDSESEDFAPMMYFGGKPYSVEVADDLSSIRLEPYAGPMGQLASDNFDFVRALSLERKTDDGAPQLISVQPVNGLLKVPAGEYGLYRCVLKADDPKTGPVMARGMLRTKPDWVKVEAGASAAFRFGAPLELRVKASQRGGGSSAAGGGTFLKALSDVFAPSAGGQAGSTDQTVDINVEVRGAGDETYDVYLKGAGLKDRAMPPKFKIIDANKKVVDSGQLEYG
ncbi:MAG: hypothetical protein NTW86_07530 [Candidatus Sumerlaeota bacterium]|nr:hypothetical protein [Candidatus Sumerlaeota bacterium]